MLGNFCEVKIIMSQERESMHSKLSDHKFNKGVFKSGFSQLITALGKEEDWVHSKSPEYIWLALILNEEERTKQLEKCMYILKEMEDKISSKNLASPTLSGILSLDSKNLDIFINILNEADVLGLISPISVVLSSENEGLRKRLKGYLMTVDERIEKLNSVLENLVDHQSQLSTDVRYLIVYHSSILDKLKFPISQKSMIDGLIEYPYLDVEDEKMRYIRPMIRSTELGISFQFFNTDSTFNKNFWENIAKYMNCEMFLLRFERNENINLTELKSNLYESLKYYRDLIQNVEQNNTKLLVLTSILTYSYKRLLELVDHNLRQTISGRSIVRSCIENFMMTKYLLKNEDQHKDIWEEFQYYGIGNYKLIFERYREENPSVEGSHVQFDYLDLLVSEYINKEFIDMDTRYFGNGNIRKKFKEVDEDFLYKYIYEYDSQFEHGLWGAIRESSILKCNAPGHQYHGIPDIDNEQSLSDVGKDVQDILIRHLEVMNEVYPNPHLEK